MDRCWGEGDKNDRESLKGDEEALNGDGERPMEMHSRVIERR